MIQVEKRDDIDDKDHHDDMMSTDDDFMMMTNMSGRRGGRGRPRIAHHFDSWTRMFKV